MAPYQNLLFVRGQEHESVVVGEKYPDALEEDSATIEEGFHKTLEMISQGAKEIRAMPLIYLPQGMYGRPDLLVRKDGERSSFGNYHYEVVEIKFAKNLRKAHLVQAAFYTRLLGFVQGATPRAFRIENGEKQLFSFDQHEHETALDEAIAGARRVLAGEVAEPCYGSCPWPWETYGNRLAEKKRDVSLIAGVGPELQAVLKTAGFKTVDDVAKTTPAKLMRVKGIGPAKAEGFHASARAIVAKRPTPRSGIVLKFPQKKYELFLDLEATDPRFDTGSLSVTNYLIGVVSRERGTTRYQPFFAQSPDQEEKTLRQFCEYLTSLDDYVIYHWHHYERTNLEKMLNFYGLSARIKARILESLVDLHPLATKAFAFPTYGSDLKSIAGCLGFKWRQEDVDALTSIVLYLEYINSSGKSRDTVKKILTYNEDDCRAAMFVKDWLVANQNR